MTLTIDWKPTEPKILTYGTGCLFMEISSFIPQVLLRYRLHPNSVNRVNLGERQFRGYSLVIQENFKKFGLPISPELAEELVVISGQTPGNPITYSYRFLPKVLLVLSEDLAQRFSQCDVR